MRDITKQDLLKASNIIRGNSCRYSFSKESKSKNKLYLMMEEREEMLKFKSDLMMAFKIINGLPVLEPLSDDSNIIIDDMLKTFAIRSGLWKGKMESVPIDSIIFKARFISNMIITIDEQINRIVSYQLKKKEVKHEIPETLSLLKQIRSCLADCIVALAHNTNNFHYTLLKIREITVVANISHCMSEKKLEQNRALVEKQLDKLDESLNGGFFVPKVEDYIIMHNLLLTAFSAVLGLDVKKTFMVTDEYTFNNKEGTKELISTLGETIWKRRNILCVDELIGYQWFINSLPDIQYKFKDINSREYLRIGCRALSYVYFITDSKKLKKLIKRLIY